MKPYAWQEPLVARLAQSLLSRDFVINGCPTGSGKTVLALASAAALGCSLLCGATASR